jgi:hypothetical protein
VRPGCGAGGNRGTRVGERERERKRERERERERKRERERVVARIRMVIELGGSVFEITHDLVGDLFRAKNAGVTRVQATVSLTW